MLDAVKVVDASCKQFVVPFVSFGVIDVIILLPHHHARWLPDN